MTTMRQWWVVPGSGGGELELREVAVPTPRPGEVVVRITGAGVNRGELFARRALSVSAPPTSGRREPRAYPSGIELAGTIHAIGSGVAGWAVGDRVMARGSACHADYASVPADALMGAPAEMADEEVAAIPNVFVTAHDAIVTAASLQPGERVVVTAGSSGVGTAALQIARSLGATAVVATSRSPAKRAALIDLGATTVIDTTDEGWAGRVVDDDPVDVVIDQVGGSLFEGLLTTLGVGGRYVSVGRNDGTTATIDLDLVARQRLQLIGVTFRTRTPAESIECSRRFAEQLLPRFDTGELRPVLHATFPLDDLPAAHDAIGDDRQIGKIVLVP